MYHYHYMRKLESICAVINLNRQLGLEPDIKTLEYKRALRNASMSGEDFHTLDFPTRQAIRNTIQNYEKENEIL